MVFGTIVMDRVRRIAGLPPLGGYAEYHDEQVFLGGEAANTAVALAKWGQEVELVSNAIGSGADAEFLRARLEAAGISDAFVPRSDESAPTCDVYLTPNGDRTMFGRALSRNGSAIPSTSALWFTADPNLGLESRNAVREAQARGMRTYLLDFMEPDDPVTASSVWQSSTDCVGTRGDAHANAEWTQVFSARYGCTAILTDGDVGCWVGVAGTVRAFPAPQIQGSVDSTGAGDAFRAGMLYGLNRSWDIERCIHFASLAGGLNTQAYGATEGIPTLEVIAEWG